MAHNATQSGSSAQLKHDDFYYYDRLPPSARQALANAKFDWSSGYYYNRWAKAVSGFKTGAAVAQRVAEADRRVKRKT